MKCIIAGSRIASLTNVIEAISKCPFSEKITEVVSGCARGADSYGELIAEEYNIPVKRFPADWLKYKKRAGILRNIEMANYADAVIAVWDRKSTGTRHMIETALERNLMLFVHYTTPGHRKPLDDLLEAIEGPLE
jgi:hypothetical protein